MPNLILFFRWIAVLPCAWLVSFFLVSIFGMLGLLMQKSGTFFRKFYFINVIGYLLCGFFFVVVGGWIAPSYKTTVVIFLAVLKIIDALRVRVLFKWTGSIATYNFTATIVGAIFAVINF